MKPSRIIISVLLVAVIIFGIFVFTANAKTTVTSTVDLSHVRKNESGNGWKWDNINEILTLTDLYIDTDDDYGLRLPEVGTIVLVGDNYISAKVAAMTFSGSCEIKGNGTLTLAGENGIWNYSQLTSDTLRFTSGNYVIKSSGDAIVSPTASVMLVGGEFDITAGKNAVNGRVVRIMQTKLTAVGSLHASYELTLKDAGVKISSASSALSVADGGKLNVAEVKIKAGTKDKLSSVAEYNGEALIETVAYGNRDGYSAIFGGTVPRFVDYIAIALAVIAVSAVVVLPIMAKKKKAEAAKKRSDEYLAEADAEYKAERKRRR